MASSLIRIAKLINIFINVYNELLNQPIFQLYHQKPLNVSARFFSCFNRIFFLSVSVKRTYSELQLCSMNAVLHDALFRTDELTFSTLKPPFLCALEPLARCVYIHQRYYTVERSRARLGVLNALSETLSWESASGNRSTRRLLSHRPLLFIGSPSLAVGGG